MTKEKKNSGGDRSTNVILEGIDKKFEQVLEGYAALDKKFDKKIDALDEKLVRFRYETRADIADLKSSSKQIMDYLKAIDDEIQDLKHRLIAKADLERLERLEGRMAEVEMVVKKFYEQKD